MKKKKPKKEKSVAVRFDPGMYKKLSKAADLRKIGVSTMIRIDIETMIEREAS